MRFPAPPLLGTSRSRALPGAGIAAAALLVVVAGCGLFDDDPAPTTLTVAPSSVEFEAVGDSRTLSVEVLDQDGRPMSGARVEWNSSDVAVATVSDNGVVTSQGNGSATITATSGSAVGSTSVVVAQAVAGLTLISGGGQTGPAGEPLSQQVQVLARDRNNNVARGATVTFTVEAGGGSFAPASMVTNTQGLATSTWTLGTQAGAQQRARVSPAATSAAITVDALSVPGEADGIELLSGDGQSAPRGRALPAPVAVVVRDRFLNPVPGVAVGFEVLTGGGSFSASPVVTAAGGEASAIWTLGTSLGDQEARVVVAGVSPLPLQATSLPEPAGMVAVEGDGQTAVAGTPVLVLPAVRVAEGDGTPVVGLTVTFRVLEGGGAVGGAAAVTDDEGVARPSSWTLGPAVGLNRLLAEVDGLDPVEFTATGIPGPPAQIQRVSGSAQAGLPGTRLASPLRVRVRDSRGNVTPGATVQFRAQQGSVSAPTAVTGPDGIAQVEWTLGSGPETQTATAFSLEPNLGPVRYYAITSDTPSTYSIDLRYLVPVSPAIEELAELAAARWATLVTGDLNALPVTAPPGACFFGEPALNEMVDDLLIYVRIQPIDGPGGILGGAAPCAVRVSDNLTVLGVIQLDSEDLDRLPPEVSSDIMVHEIGHVLGFGTLWGPFDFDLRRNPSLPDAVGADTHFTGPRAIAAFDALGGAAFNASKVPLENTQGGQGTRDSHWRESVLRDELMTGFLSTSAPNPLSLITLEALADMGYVVNPAAVEPYSVELTPAQQAPPSEPLRILDDVLAIPLRVLDDRGGLVRIVPRDFR